MAEQGAGSNQVDQKKVRLKEIAKTITILFRRDGIRTTSSSIRKVTLFINKVWGTSSEKEDLVGYQNITIKAHTLIKAFMLSEDLTLEQFLSEAVISEFKVVLKAHIKIQSLEVNNLKEALPSVLKILGDELRIDGKLIQSDLLVNFWKYALLKRVSIMKQWPLSYERELISSDLPWQRELEVLWEKIFIELCEENAEETAIDLAAIYACYYEQQPLAGDIIALVSGIIEITTFIITVGMDRALPDIAKVSKIIRFIDSKPGDSFANIPILKLIEKVLQFFHVDVVFDSTGAKERSLKLISKFGNPEKKSFFKRVLLIVVALKGEAVRNKFEIQSLFILTKIELADKKEKRGGKPHFGWIWGRQDVWIGIKDITALGDDEFMHFYLNEQFLFLREDAITFNSIHAKSNIINYLRGHLMEIYEKQVSNLKNIKALRAQLIAENIPERAFKIKAKINYITNDAISKKKNIRFYAINYDGGMVHIPYTINLKDSLKLNDTFLKKGLTDIKEILDGEAWKKQAQIVLFIE